MAATDQGRREPVYASVQAKLRAFVAEEAIEPGTRLPPERDLARRLGVSRTSLRQALTALRVEGLIDVRHGDGVYLLRSVDDVVPPIAAELRAAHPELPALGEVRNALEALAAEFAATRRTDADLAAMVAGLRLMDSEIAGGESGFQGDREFHRAVLDAAANEVLTKLMDAIADGSEQIARASLSRPGQPERSLAAHRMILDAIVMRESELARRLMFDHLELTGTISKDVS
jgi:GntR family transcriptional regulator, transcriptional repressor for pyruvate dehydrogenase complex